MQVPAVAGDCLRQFSLVLFFGSRTNGATFAKMLFLVNSVHFSGVDCLWVVRLRASSSQAAVIPALGPVGTKRIKLGVFFC